MSRLVGCRRRMPRRSSRRSSCWRRARRARKASPTCRYGRPTAEMVECLSRQAKVWDRRLNEEYQKLMQSVQGGQREKLRAAQRVWVQYRDANCAYYAAGEGTNSRVQAAECMRSMTESRTQELEQAGGQN